METKVSIAKMVPANEGLRLQSGPGRDLIFTACASFTGRNYTCAEREI